MSTPDPTQDRQTAGTEPPPKPIRQFFANWQEFILWIPGLVILTVVGAFLFGALPGMPSMADTLAMLAELPAMCAYAAAACAFCWLFMRTNIFLMRRRDLKTMFDEARHGSLSAFLTLAAYLTMWFSVLCAFLWFFYPAR